MNYTQSVVVRCVGSTGIMFLNEVALGKEHHITNDDWTLTKPPNGYDCIIAKGHTEPGKFFQEETMGAVSL